MYLGDTIAVAIDEMVRYAALFFDKVAIANYERDDVPPESFWQQVVPTIDGRILRLKDFENPKKYDYIVDHWGRDLISRKDPHFVALPGQFDSAPIQPPDDYDPIWDKLSLADNNILDAYELLQRKGINAVPFFYNKSSFDALFDTPSQSGIALSLIGIDVVDPYSLDWDQVLEIRRDRGSLRKLRNFRMFLYRNFDGKSVSYVRDNILKAIEEYENACRKHGIDMIHAAVNSILNSKSLLATSALTTSSILSGHPEWASVTVLSGCAVEIGKLCITMAKKHYDHRMKTSESEVAYLVDLKEIENGFQQDAPGDASEPRT